MRPAASEDESGADALARLQLENAELAVRLREAEETLSAIRSGEVDAVVVGNDVYTLDSSNIAANLLRQDVLAQMQDAVLAFDLEDHVIYMNAAAERHCGQPMSDVLGRHKREVLLEFERDGGQAAVRDRLGASTLLREHAVHRLPGGGEINVEITASPLRDAAGQDRGLLCVVRNIDDRVRADAALEESKARLQEADRRKDEFLATLAHELRNPLAPIRNALQLMQLSPAPEVHANARNIIDRQVRQMVRLVDDLLDVSRISRGKMELRREAADLARIMQSAVETSRPLVEAGKHELLLQLPPPGSLMVEADVTRLCQVISNLLNNAAKYTPEGGRIELFASQQGDDAVVTVRDNGIGIPREMLPRVFEMFTQIDRSAERSQGGLGIGLALVKQLLDLHGGSIAAHSEGAGTGSAFTVRLPLMRNAIEKHEDEPRSNLAPPANFRVLVVDDNVDSASSMATVLEMLGYRTAVANDGRQAVALAEEFRPHVMLLDIGLPLLTGHEVARRVRATPWGADVLLIALSGWGQDADKEKSALAGFDHHFTKPVDLAELMALVATAHGGQGTR